jgi:hypothetical protein
MFFDVFLGFLLILSISTVLHDRKFMDSATSMEFLLIPWTLRSWHVVFVLFVNRTMVVFGILPRTWHMVTLRTRTWQLVLTQTALTLRIQLGKIHDSNAFNPFVQCSFLFDLD